MRAQEQIESWDRLLTAVRSTLRARGLAEVITPARVAEIALEPFIEPIRASPGLLRTSPELAHKQLISEGAGNFFEVAAVFRRGEHGARHREEFHLLEWYRVESVQANAAGPVGARVDGDADENDPRHGAAGARVDLERGRCLADACLADLEAVVQAVFEALEPVRTRAGQDEPGQVGLRSNGAPRVGHWRTESFFDLFSRTVGIELRGDEGVEDLIAALTPVRPQWASALRKDCAHASTSKAETAAGAGSAAQAGEQLRAWSSLWSFWSDADLDPWLEAQGGGIHLREFPPILAALAEISPSRSTVEGGHPRLVAQRTESYVAGIELGNGYLELRDGQEQRRRFEAVRALHSDDATSSWMDDHWPAGFLAMLDARPLPRCAGLAMGLERLLCVALGRRDMDGLLPADRCRPAGPSRGNHAGDAP